MMRPKVLLLGATVAVVAAVALPSSAFAATVPPGSETSVVVGGLAAPTSLAVGPDGRIFVAEQGGILKIVTAGIASTALTLTVDDHGERGLIGVTLDPLFPTAPYVYVHYTATQPQAHNRVSRFTLVGPQLVDEDVLIDLPPLGSATNHNGGAIHFGADGTLFVGVGDNARRANAQELTNPFGKLLRINADGTVPTDNPFVGVAGADGRIWALGLRNPYAFGVQPGTGRLLISDVGESTWEEINEGAKGANYGWPVVEGPSSDPAYVAPLYAYSHSEGCAIIGGAFYNPTSASLPALVGRFLFADYCSGWIHALDPATGNVVTVAEDLGSPSDLAVGPDGTVYASSRAAGTIVRIAGITPPPVVPEAGLPVLLSMLALVVLGIAATFHRRGGRRTPFA